MHFAAIFGAAALLSAASAAPLKRDVDVETETVTHVDIVVEMVTTTVWVDATDAPSAAQYTAPAVPTTTSTAPVVYSAPDTSSLSSTQAAVSVVPTATISSTTVAAPAPTTSSTTAAAPAPTTSSSSIVDTTQYQAYAEPWTASTTTSETPITSDPAVAAPTTSTTDPAPAVPSTTSYTDPAPAAPTTTQEVASAAPATTTQAAAPAATSASSSTGQTYSGDITYYDVGLGSCGTTNTDTDYVVAMSAAMMDKATMCGKSITLSYEGVTKTATVEDTCPGCASGSLDLSPALFSAVAPTGDGRVHNVEWWFN